MFSVGDEIRGKAGNPGNYGVTTERMTRGLVTRIDSPRSIRVKILEHKNAHEVGSGYDVNPIHFELAVDVTKENAFELYLSGKISEEKYNEQLKEI